jgi:hypothetical protein
MCLYGVYKQVNIINPNQNKNVVVVDACIADEIQRLNDLGVITLSCCCSHGLAGQITEWENGSGKWKGHYEPPHTLIDRESVELVKKQGYSPYPYYYADGEHHNVWQLVLKTGCLTKEDCIAWHQENGLPLEKNIGIIT